MGTDKIENHLNKLKQFQTGKQRVEVEQQVSKAQLDASLHNLYAEQIAGKVTKDEFGKRLYSVLNNFQSTTDTLSRNEAKIEVERAKLEAQLFEACQFDTRTLTKEMAVHLTDKTGDTWLPIRYLIKKGSEKVWPREAYAVVQAEALLNIPNIADTITLLKTPYYVAPPRYNITHTEAEYPKITVYENVDERAMNYIWDLGSYSFISLADSSKFNALFNLNRTKNKPFLHLPLSKDGEKILADFDTEYDLYRNYRAPRIEYEHPRAIATRYIERKVNRRLEYQYQTEQNLANYR